MAIKKLKNRIRVNIKLYTLSAPTLPPTLYLAAYFIPRCLPYASRLYYTGLPVCLPACFLSVSCFVRLSVAIPQRLPYTSRLPYT